MERKAVSGIMLILLLVSVLFVMLDVPVVVASGTIYIRADGSIDPPTAPIYTPDNITYTLTGDDITPDADGIVIERDNIVVDGAGYTLQGIGSGNGLELSGRSNVTIKNMEIKAFSHGIRLDYSSNYNSISGNNITNNEHGIGLYWDSNYNSISGNNITNNEEGIRLDESSNNVIYHNNLIDNTRQVYDTSWDYPDTPSINIWDNSYPFGGNYWSDYTGVDQYNGTYQNVTGSDGIGDTPYTIDANNRDNYPLIDPYILTEVGDLGNAGGFFDFDGLTNAYDLNLFIQCYNDLAPPNAMYLGDLGSAAGFFFFDGLVNAYDLTLFIQCYNGLGPDS